MNNENNQEEFLLKFKVSNEMIDIFDQEICKEEFYDVIKYFHIEIIDDNTNENIGFLDLINIDLHEEKTLLFDALDSRTGETNELFHVLLDDSNFVHPYINNMIEDDDEFFYTNTFWYLEKIVINNEYRNKNIGKMILKNLREIIIEHFYPFQVVKEELYFIILLLVYPIELPRTTSENIILEHKNKLKRFYESCGFEVYNEEYNDYYIKQI